MIRDEERERDREERSQKKKSPLEGGREHDKRGRECEGGRVTIVKRL
jgi:hypothetical protein